MFPLNGDKKPFGGSSGFYDATVDPGFIEDEFTKPGRTPVFVGVDAGRSGVIALDIDQKNGKDGFARIEENWLTVTPTVFYPTLNGGEHHIYLVPDEEYYKPAVDYRGMEGVDRRSGGSYFVWYGDVPKRSDLAVAPDWLLDKDETHTLMEYDGDVETWMSELTPGEPSAFVRHAIDKLSELTDLNHAEMVAAQFNAVRLGAEGHPGVPEMLEVIRGIWMNRNPDDHSTPKAEWGPKFREALDSAIRKYGQQIEQLRDLPEFDHSVVPTRAHDRFFGEFDADNREWGSALREMIEVEEDDRVIASALWNAPRTKALSQEWGIEFVYQRIELARNRPEPTRENPTLPDNPEDYAQSEQAITKLLTPREVEYVEKRPTFVEKYVSKMKELGFVNEPLARASAWTCASMAFAFHVFIPKSGTDNMGVNLWFQVPAPSGTGKSRSRKAQDALLKTMFKDDNDEAGFQLGEDSSLQGMNLTLLQRDGQASILDVDEASGFFERVVKTDWMTGIDSIMAHWYEGYVSPSNKISLKELRGKSAMTSFNVHMLATPDRLFETLNRGMFKTGFLARFNWVIGPEPTRSDARFEISQYESNGHEIDLKVAAPQVRDLAVDLLTAVNGRGPTPILMDKDAQRRMSEAYKQMYTQAEGTENWDILEPSITRLSETMHKVAAISAVYRGSNRIELCDALRAIYEVQTWYDNLFRVAGMISASEFQRNAEDIVAYLSNLPGGVTHAKLYHQFRNLVVRSRRDLDDLIDWLITSGRINRYKDGQTMKYRVNGL